MVKLYPGIMQIKSLDVEVLELFKSISIVEETTVFV